MRVVDLLFVAVDERLEDAAYVRANSGRVSRAILLINTGETYGAEGERCD